MLPTTGRQAGESAENGTLTGLLPVYMAPSSERETTLCMRVFSIFTTCTTYMLSRHITSSIAMIVTIFFLIYVSIEEIDPESSNCVASGPSAPRLWQLQRRPLHVCDPQPGLPGLLSLAFRPSGQHARSLEESKEIDIFRVVS